MTSGKSRSQFRVFVIGVDAGISYDPVDEKRGLVTRYRVTIPSLLRRETTRPVAAGAIYPRKWQSTKKTPCYRKVENKKSYQSRDDTNSMDNRSELLLRAKESLLEILDVRRAKIVDRKDCVTVRSFIRGNGVSSMNRRPYSGNLAWSRGKKISGFTKDLVKARIGRLGALSPIAGHCKSETLPLEAVGIRPNLSPAETYKGWTLCSDFSKGEFRA